MSFTIEKNNINHGLPLVFIDSLHFLNGSLDNLVRGKLFLLFLKLTYKSKSRKKDIFPY